MSDIVRYGTAGGTGTGGQHLPFARAVAADGWLFVSGQVPMQDGEVVAGGIVEQSDVAIRNLIAILHEVHVAAVVGRVFGRRGFGHKEVRHN